MDATLQATLAQMGTELTALAVKGTATAVSTKVKTIKAERDAEKIKNYYNEIISELIEEREEILRIAQAYRHELEKIEITLKDIVNVDTLKTMQLLGFNYKEAIGIPLTKLCAKAIENLSNKKNITKKK